MKVLLVNGSPHEKGCTFTALSEAAGALEGEGIQTEIIYAGQPLGGCRGCGACRRNGGRCVTDGDAVNIIIDKAKECDGFIFGSPVHYAAASGSITSIMDRCFYANSATFAFKPAACVLSCRRGGASAAFDQLNKYFTIACMPVVSSQYWNMVHGNTPDEVRRDLEGMQIMRTLGRNMAWLVRCIALGAAQGVPAPVREAPVATNFIR